MKEIVQGNVVKLKSGGPEMTVLRVIGQENSNSREIHSDKLYVFGGHNIGDVVCEWFDKLDAKCKIFKSSSLELIKE
ncbi:MULTISPECIES: DUF2158 domain-containing protein [unclassified Flavobacterium]|jgi:uncharacterized protein YodC (DUF2158 family)|uniref:DUF2158 domain-containing protein n=1 Tax=unclassified Flavobacterium TaxID=196869 RepID=UPI0025C7226A|nr:MULTISPECIES: DUF2158 domain-containing protein [unclassified Flavobacterium]